MQCCIVFPIFFSLRSRNYCAVKCWKLRSFRITAGSLSMKHWSVLCLGGFYIGFYLQQRRGEILSFTRKPRTEPRSWMGPKVKPCSPSPPLLRPVILISVAAKAAAEGSVWCQAAAAAPVLGIVCCSPPSAGRHQLITAVPKQQPGAEGAFPNLCRSVAQ